jgi:SPP1 family predicted phage head-tail adaptor
MPMIGPKNVLMTISAPNVTRTPEGDAAKVYVEIAQVWASVQHLRGEERILADTLTEKLSHRIRINYDSRLAAMQGNYRGKITQNGIDRHFDFKSVAIIHERNAEFEIMAEEHKNEPAPVYS